MTLVSHEDILDADMLFDDLTDPYLNLHTERPRLIVVEDDDTMRGLLFSRLSTDGYQIDMASTAEEALDMLAPEAPQARPPLTPFDLVLTDHHLRGWSGLAMLSEVRSMGWDAPLILMTEFADATLQRITHRLGIEIMEKPFGLDQLSSMITRLLVTHATPQFGRS